MDEEKIKSNRRRIIIKLSLSYSLVSLIPLLFLIIFSIISSTIISRSMLDTNKLSLDACSLLFDNAFIESSQLSEELLVNKEVNTFVNSEISSLEPLELYNISSALRHILFGYSAITDLYLYSQSDDLYISDESWGDLDHFHLMDELELNLDYESTSELLCKEYKKLTLIDISYDSPAGRVYRLLIIRPISYIKQQNKNSVITIAVVDFTQGLKNQNSNLIILNSENLCVFNTLNRRFSDSEITKISSIDSGSYERIDDYIIQPKESIIPGFTYYSFVSRTTFYYFVKLSMIVAVTLFFIALLSGFLFIARVVKKEYKAYFDALDKSGSILEDSKNIYTPFINSVSKLKEKEDLMTQLINEQRYTLKENIISKLVTEPAGVVSMEALKSSGISFASKRFVVLILKGDESELKEYVKLSFQEPTWYLFPFNSNHGTSFILNISDKLSDDEIYKEIESRMESLISKQANIFDYGASSNVVNGINRVGEAYLDAINVLEYGANSSSHEFLFYRDIIGMSMRVQYSYTSDDELELYSLLESGDSLLSEKKILELVEANREAKVSPRGLRYLLFSIVGTIIRVSNKLEKQYGWPLPRIYFSSIIQSPSFQNSLNEILRNVSTLTNAISQIRSENSGDGEESYFIYQKALKLINQEYSSPILNISYLAELLDISNVYLSKIFKKYHNQNISDYLAEYRVMIAKRLLAEDIPLKEIVDKTGFGSLRTFLRVFKKVENITPTQYKNMRMEEKNV